MGATHRLPLAAHRRTGLQNVFWSKAKYLMADTVDGALPACNGK